MDFTSPSSSKVAFSVREFFARFPDDEACLTHIMQVRFGMKHVCRKCGIEATFHRMTDRRAWACAHCGDHVYPTAGTVFQDTRTPLVSWFYAIYLFVTTRHGVSGKELQRQLGVTYKTAYRMGMQIRKLIGSTQNFDLMQGHVELDETYVGGKRSGGKPGRGAPGKTIVMGIANRDSGEIRAEVIPNVKAETLRGVVLDNVAPGATVSTDQLWSYGLLSGDGYKHGRVNHTRKEWSRRDEHGERFSTNTIEGFWRMFKVSVRSTHIHISKEHMQAYVSEFAFRSTHRAKLNAMFDLLIAAI
jgi:transposase-like protein/ribosomal protein L37AE/L43A